MRVCKYCGGSEPDVAFGSRSNVKCKKCIATDKRAVRERNPEAVRSVQSAYYHADPARRMVYSAKARAKSAGIPFDIEPSDIPVPEFCPALGIRLTTGGPRSPSSPSLDRLIPELGYVRGNCVVISDLANRIKNTADAVQLRAIADWLERVITP